ncbi:uncharacterized protein LOC117178331 [Belonocnema kinseyi]|uniref:uncharacterized protein LOC117178331 n=1 Tax=Belonocnema kinseyi TaxID=2817044 RepID=UPI00143D80C1|nr:uncharacterized protein LOC117178331 [Belonocnema kinseyi]
MEMYTYTLFFTFVIFLNYVESFPVLPRETPKVTRTVEVEYRKLMVYENVIIGVTVNEVMYEFETPLPRRRDPVLQTKHPPSDDQVYLPDGAEVIRNRHEPPIGTIQNRQIHKMDTSEIEEPQHLDLVMFHEAPVAVYDHDHWRAAVEIKRIHRPFHILT